MDDMSWQSLTPDLGEGFRHVKEEELREAAHDRVLWFWLVKHDLWAEGDGQLFHEFPLRYRVPSWWRPGVLSAIAEAPRTEVIQVLQAYGRTTCDFLTIRQVGRDHRGFYVCVDAHDGEREYLAGDTIEVVVEDGPGPADPTPVPLTPDPGMTFPIVRGCDVS